MEVCIGCSRGLDGRGVVRKSFNLETLLAQNLYGVGWLGGEGHSN